MLCMLRKITEFRIPLPHPPFTVPVRYAIFASCYSCPRSVNSCSSSIMPIGKIATTSGKGADYSAGSVNIEHNTVQSGGKSVTGYQKTSAGHSYGAGALNIAATTEVPKVKENLGYAKSEVAGQSSYGAGAVGITTATNAPKIKHEGLGHVDKKVEVVHEK